MADFGHRRIVETATQARGCHWARGALCACVRHARRDRLFYRGLYLLIRLIRADKGGDINGASIQ
jgi:hypothetical protein